jgi:ATP/maltotriose-dependent transcriptional regulator MalT
MALLMLLLRWLEWRFIIFDNAIEVYMAAIAVIFTLLGIWLALKLAKPKVKTIVVEKEIFIKNNDGFIRSDKAITDLGLSSREVEVLQLMAEGLSNNEIAEKLFLSLNTIKTHSSRLFEILNVKRRTQAVEKGRQLMIIA